MTERQTQEPASMPDTTQVESLLHEVEERLSRLRDWQQDQARHEEDLSKQFALVTEQRERLQARAGRLRQAVAALHERHQQVRAQAADLGRREQALAQRVQDLESRTRALARQDQDLARREKEIADAQGQVNAQRAELESQSQKLASRQRELEEATKAAEQQSRKLQEQTQRDRQQVAHSQRKLEADAAEIAARQGQLEHQRQQLETLRREALEQQRQLEEARAKLAEEQAAVAARRQQLDAEAQELARRQEQIPQEQAQRARQELEQAWQQVRQQQTVLDHARAALDEEKQSLGQREQAVAGQQTKLRERQNEIETQWQQIEEAQQESHNQAAAIDEEHRQTIQRLEQQLAQQSQALRQAQEESQKQATSVDQEHRQTIQRLQQQLAQQTQALQQAQQQVEQHKQELSDQSQEVAKARSTQADRAATDEFFQELAQREEALKQRRLEFEKQQQSLEAAQRELEAHRRELRAREETLAKRERQHGGVQPAAAGKPGADDHLRQREANLADRQERLEHYHQLLRERSKALAKSAQRQTQKIPAGGAAELQHQRQALLEVKQFLEASEAEMVRRWATHKAGGLAITLLLALAMLAIFSYMMGQRLVSPVWQASAVIDLADAPGGGEQWVQQQRQMALSQPVLREVLAQLRQRNIRLFADEADLAEHIDRHLRLSRDTAYRLRLQYDSPGNDGAELSLQMVDSLAYALLTQQAASASDDTDGAGARPRVVQPAVREPFPVRDWRWPVSAVIFALGLLAGGAGYLVLRRWLRGAAHVFDGRQLPAMAAVTNDQQWEALGSPPRKP